MTRLMFLNIDRLPELLLTLMYDRFLTPRPEHTIIYYGNASTAEPVTDNYDRILIEKFHEYGIDHSKIELVNDYELFQNCQYNLTDLGGWLYQQFIKLLALDKCSDEYILIQDADAFAIEPYQWFDRGQPVPLVQLNATQYESYYEYLSLITGLKRQTPHCFVTEFLPIKKESWNALKSHIETMHGLDWLSVLYRIFKENNAGVGVGTFSEYELLGNWMTSCNPGLAMTSQRQLTLGRDSYKRPQKYNFVATKRNMTYEEISTTKKYIDTLIKEQS
jgi:hypothetical protein